MIYDLPLTTCKLICNSRSGVGFVRLTLLLSTLSSQLSTVLAFEGRINATIAQGNQTDGLLYTVGANFLRVEMTATNWPNPVDIWDRNSGALTLLFPHNRSFVRLKQVAENSSALPLGFPQVPGGLGPDVGPRSQQPGAPVMPGALPPTNLPGGFPPGIGPTNLPAMPAIPNPPAIPAPPLSGPPGVGPLPPPATTRAAPGMPAIPAMPMLPMEKMVLQATGDKTNLLGFACQKFEIRQRGETMEIWATDQLLPFRNYVRNQTQRFGPRMIEARWSEMVEVKKLFPLLAILKFENGPELLRFEVTSLKAEKIEDKDGSLFQPLPDYQEIQPLPF